jgi:hypothetical protein
MAIEAIGVVRIVERSRKIRDAVGIAAGSRECRLDHIGISMIEISFSTNALVRVFAVERRAG